MSATTEVRVKVAQEPTYDTDFLQYFDDGDFPESNVVRLGFRTTQMSPEEHWLNRSAVHLTKELGEVYPFGSMCHLELLVQIRHGVWVKMSVSKKKCIDGVWSNGCVHMMRSEPAEWKKKYLFLCVHADRYAILQMLRFYTTQNNGAFNPYSYYGALFGGWGINRYHPRLLKEQESWYCTEAICCALQCLIAHMKHVNHSPDSWQSKIQKMRCCRTNPNQMFRVLANSYGVSNAFKPGMSVVDSV